MRVFTLFPHIKDFVIINSHQSVQFPVNAFQIRRLYCYLGVDVENWLDNARMYNGYINQKKHNMLLHVI